MSLPGRLTTLDGPHSDITCDPKQDFFENGNVLNLINIFRYLREICCFLIQEGGCLHSHCHETIKSHLSHDVRCIKYDDFQKKSV